MPFKNRIRNAGIGLVIGLFIGETLNLLHYEEEAIYPRLPSNSINTGDTLVNALLFIFLMFIIDLTRFAMNKMPREAILTLRILSPFAGFVIGGLINDEYPDRRPINALEDIILLPRAVPQLQPYVRRQMDPNLFFNQALNDYNPSMKEYIASFRNKIKFSDALSELELTAKEQEKLSECEDPVFMRLMDIPVLLYGHSYDLDTLLNLNPRKDPITTYAYTIRDIQADRVMAEKIQGLINEFKNTRRLILRA